MQFRKSRTDTEGGFEPFDRPSRKGSRRSGEARGDHRKVHQLCAQVREVVGFALAERWHDPVLERLSIVSVTPAPDASRLAVIVAIDPDGDPVEAVAIIDALKRIRGELRCEIAAEIHRKKTPELTFELAPLASQLGEGEA